MPTPRICLPPVTTTLPTLQNKHTSPFDCICLSLEVPTLSLIVQITKLIPCSRLTFGLAKWLLKMSNRNHETVIEEFESGWTGSKDSLLNFIRDCAPATSSDFQFELLKRDLRLRLRSGSTPLPSDYAEDFPQFIADLEAAIVSEATSIAQDESPIERVFGELPQVIGGYEVVEQLDRDSVSVHYDAHQLSLSRNVRFRVLHFPSEENIAKACKVATLERSSMETVIEVLRSRSTCIIVSQIEHGESVADLVSGCPEKVTTRQGVSWIADATDSLLELHRNDVAHLNVSPSNLIARCVGGGVLIEPNFDCALDSIKGNRTAELNQLPFPYRSLRANSKDPSDLWKEDVVALGLLMFVLLTKVSLDSFYSSPPLPDEAKRLKTLIKSHLEYSSEIDPPLKRLCQRTTLGIMDDRDPCYLPELKVKLGDWQNFDDPQKQNESKVHDKHSQSGSLENSISKGFNWVSKQ